VPLQSRAVKQQNLFLDLLPPIDKPIRFSPAARPIWTENKSQLIERYLFYFVLITKHGTYIDGFAGPQYATKLDAWSAKRVLGSQPSYLREFWLCELAPKGVASLEQLIREQPKRKGRSITLVPGDFNRNVSTILERSKITEKTASFCLLDQRTFECEWSTVQTIASYKKTNKIEIFYFLASGWLNRSIAATSKNHDVVERWWGKSDWQSLRGMKAWDRLNLILGRFKSELGYKHVFAWPIYSRENGGRVLYHMIHATDHDEAPKIMHRAYRNAVSEREELKRLQHDLAELWGTSGSGSGLTT